MIDVLKVNPATQRSLAQSTALIKQTLNTQLQTTAANAVDQRSQEVLAQPDQVPRAVRDVVLQRIQGTEGQFGFDHRRPLSWATVTQPKPPLKR